MKGKYFANYLEDLVEDNSVQDSYRVIIVSFSVKPANWGEHICFPYFLLFFIPLVSFCLTSSTLKPQ